MRIVEPPADVSVMAIAAHPDDIESWCAGALARAVDAGCSGRLLLVTSGERGTSDPSVTPEALARRREDETRAAALHLGLADVAFLHYPDGDVENSRALRGDLVAWIRRWRPRALFTHDPENPVPPYLTHRDHRITGRAVLDAVYPLARDPLNFLEHRQLGLAPHKVQQVWLFASARADAFVDITAVFARKVAARLEHGSQTSDSQALTAGWRARAAAIGAPAGLPLAEAFTILDLD